MHLNNMLRFCWHQRFGLWISLFVIVMFILLACSCRKSGTEPDNPPPQTGLDTTSHDFIWRIDTLGNGPQFSSLWDVAIINENDIWVVGDIHMEDTYQQDSLGNIIPPFNAAHWDGNEWKLIRVPVKIWNTNQFIISELRILNRLEDQEIWAGDGGEIIKYKDGEWKEWEFLFDDPADTTKGAVQELWGRSTNSVYAVDSRGNVQFYNGQFWERLPRIVTSPISDIWGQANQRGDLFLYATVSTEMNNQDSQILKIENNVVTEVSSEGLPNDISGIWFDRDAGYYVVGDGIFYTPFLDDTSQWEELVPDITGYYTDAIAANGGNDLIIAGSFGTVIHYNGSTWRNYENDLPYFYGRYKRVKMKSDLVVAVGYLSDGPTRGIILTGKRIPQ